MVNFQSDVPRVGRAGNTSRMWCTVQLWILTRTTHLKIVAVLFFLSSFLKFSESLAGVRGREEDTWRSKAYYVERIVPVPSSSGRLGIDSTGRYFIPSDINSRLSKLTDGLVELAHSPSSAFSLVQSSTDSLPRRSLATISPTAAPSPSSQPPPPPPVVNGFVCGICGESYTAGIVETVPSVAVYCHVFVEQILALNPGIAISSNITLQKIKIPCRSRSAVRCTRCGHDAIIRAGDTLDQLAKGCNLTLRMVELANPNIDYSNIFPAQYITLPCANGRIVEKVTGCGVCGRGLTAENDSLTIGDIGMRCKASVNQLLEANPAVNSTAGRIIRGQFIRVPCSGNDPANCGPCGNSYTTVKGDTLMVIAAKCRVGFIVLTNQNPGIDLTKDEENLRVSIPCNSIPPSGVCSPCHPFFSSNESVEISRIATICDVPTELIALANDLPLSGSVPAGRNLSIPCTSLPRRNLRNCGNCGSSFTLASQVTLEAIAGACGTTVAAIRAENGNFTFDLLGPKDEVSLPCNMPHTDCGPCGIGYTTESSETLESVAVKCATPAGQIARANPQHDFSQPLMVDQTLHIPCSSGSLSSSTVLLQPLGCSNQMLHVFVMLIMLKMKFIWHFL